MLAWEVRIPDRPLRSLVRIPNNPAPFSPDFEEAFLSPPRSFEGRVKCFAWEVRISDKPCLIFP
jgi:hypothetical protein